MTWPFLPCRSYFLLWKETVEQANRKGYIALGSLFADPNSPVVSATQGDLGWDRSSRAATAAYQPELLISRYKLSGH